MTQIRIIDATARLVRAPETLFDAAEIGLPAFGWNLPNVKLGEAFAAARSGLANLTTIETSLDDLERTDGGWSLRLGNGETLLASLVVGADGKKSRVRESAGFRARENGFREAALVCDLALERPLGGASVEFHYDRGPFTLVPAGDNRANLVWIDDRDTLKAAQRGRQGRRSQALFAEKSQRLFGGITVADAGPHLPALDAHRRNRRQGRRRAAPAKPRTLSRRSARRGSTSRCVMWPTSPRRWPTADLVSSRASQCALSEDYARRRAGDLARTGTVVDALFRSLLAGFLPIQALRAGGLWALKLVPPLRRLAFDVGMGVR